MQKSVFRLSYLLPLLISAFAPWILLYFLANPSCMWPISNDEISKTHDVNLRAMVVGDLHIGGPTTVWFDRMRRDAFMKASFKRAFEKLRPDMLLILGDLSDWGRKSSKEEWNSVILRFKDMMIYFKGSQYHVIPGNHDIGDYYQITDTLLQQFTDSFPSLDEMGNSFFVLRNISFVSLNAMALACDHCSMHNSMKVAVEGYKIALQQAEPDDMYMSIEENQSADRHRHSIQDSSAGPVLLTHLPLYREDESVCGSLDIPICAPWHEVEGGCIHLLELSKNSGHYKRQNYRKNIDMLSLNTTNYLLSALKPRLVLSAHAHRFCSRLLDTGTREVTVSTFTWRNRDDPSFLLVQFYKDGSYDIQQCFLVRESVVVLLHLFQGILLFVLLVFGGHRCWKLRKSNKLHLKS
ncbi:hypothetical protein KP509_09G057800 [Ceratopteris richardii]|uniref:Calcineurin-like phosphoesterase domain-containing protein n=1 Tax=Ceratopteris richardii TaxID=49495 RepID=A0A8T2U895_CERRI|nr:hypothetical protein KP509_09G057800 [Ceratopteris richardii]